MEEKLGQRWATGLPLMHYARRRSKKAQEVSAAKGGAGRPAARKMAHEALHAALMGLAKA